MDKNKIKGTFKLELVRTNETEPYKVLEFNNLITTLGVRVLEDLFIGESMSVFDVAHAYVGSGDDDTAPDAAQTDLQAATNKVRIACTDVFRNLETLSWKATFGADDANWEWKEVAVFNAPTGATMFCRALVDIPFVKDNTFAVAVTYTWTLV